MTVDIDVRRTQTAVYMSLGRLLRGIEDTMGRLFAEQGLDDVTPAQANVLLLLIEAGRPLTAREVADRLSLSAVTVHRFVLALHKNGWISRTPHPQDGRALLLAPTEKVHQRLPDFLKVVTTMLDTAFAHLDVPQTKTLLETVRTADDALRAMDHGGGG